MSETCPLCGEAFPTAQGVRNHRAQSHDRIEPWQDETTMRYLYEGKRLSSDQIAEILPCNRGNVKRWLRKHGIERRTPSEAARLRVLRIPPHFRTHGGYEEVCTQVDGSHKVIGIHRLLAVAEYGFDAVSGNVVHHRNGIPWDNRPENIELLTRADHTRRHYERGDLRYGPGGGE